MKKINITGEIPSKLNPLTSSYIDENITNINTVKEYYRSLNKEKNGSSIKKPKLKFNGYDSNKEYIRLRSNKCCGFCGSPIEQSAIIVEHYRPKNRLDSRKYNLVYNSGKFDKEKNPTEVVSEFGYFLWGNDHDNLIPSCISCNSGHGKDSTYIKDRTEYIPYGKDNFFPIKKKKFSIDPRSKTKIIRNIKNEKPLLFNPYLDDPVELFEYKKSALLAIIYIRPKQNTSKFNRLKSMVTINLLGLNRTTLCEKRHTINYDLDNMMKQLEINISFNNRNLQEYAKLSENLLTYHSETRFGQALLIKEKCDNITYIFHKMIKTIFLNETSSFHESTKIITHEMKFDLENFSLKYKSPDKKITTFNNCDDIIKMMESITSN